MVLELAIKKNRLLAALPEEIVRAWKSNLELVDLPLGRVLHEPGTAPNYVFFPISAIVSILHVMSDGASAEIAVIGREGMVGIGSFMGGNSTTGQAVVQSAGQGLQLSTTLLKAEFAKSTTLLRLLLRYAQALITQMAQTAACNRHHTLSQQLCRWLLLSLDRIDSKELLMTQELIANMLGVRREGVTAEALKLQKAGLIRYSRGRITVTDRAGLERQTCECYAVVKKEYDRLLP